jgi:DNA-binding MarR family transcriptional regulator
VDDQRVRTPGAAFLLAQLGGHSSRQWVERLAEVTLDPREVMLFRHVALNEGRSQREVADAVGLPASRIVRIVDALEAKGWIRRRPGKPDRRAKRLYLTPGGKAALDRIMAVSAAHEAELTRGLTPDERAELVRMLARIAAEQGLIEGVHPGFADASGPDGLDGGSPLSRTGH